APPAELLEHLLCDLNQVAIANFGGFAVHAGAVARGEVVAAFPAASETGKSTLTAACLTLGLHYVSDEALCIDFADDSVVPYPKPLKLSGGAAAMIGIDTPLGSQSVAVGAADLGAKPAVCPLRLGHLVLLVRRTGLPVLHRLERAEAVAALLAMSFNHYRDPGRSFSLACRLAVGAQAWRLDYGDPLPAARLLVGLLDGAPRPAALAARAVRLRRRPGIP
ncbi:MAG: hypothetical protein M3N98_10280, partial [Actinomycetota bacterium]|nr:hypothetical protein [Actinomycetota bacterium]